MTKISFFGSFAFLSNLASLGSAATILSTDFTGVDTSGTSATGIVWTTQGIQTPASSLTFYDPANPSTTFGFISGGTPADNIQIARNIETAGPWSTSIAITPLTTIDLTGFALDFRAISAAGANQSASKTATYTVEIFDGSTSLGSFADTVTDPGGGTAAGDRADIDLTPLANLQPGTSYTFVLTVSASATLGNNVAIDNLELTGTFIPEPSFSLLLLAGGALFLGRRQRR